MNNMDFGETKMIDIGDIIFLHRFTFRKVYI